MNQRKLLENDYCKENLNKMRTIESGKHCLNCDKNILDLSKINMKDVVKNHYNTNKCVILSKDQIDLLISFKNIQKFTIAASLFIGVSFHNLTYSQTLIKNTKQIDSCLIKGKLIDVDREPIANRSIYLRINDCIYETTTLNNGNFAISVPKNCKIEYSNIKRLNSKKIRNRNILNLKKVKMKFKRSLKSPGFF